MERATNGRRSPCRLQSGFLVLVSVLLVASLAVQILPFGSVDFTSGEPGERSCCIEPLQFCDDGEGFEGFLYDLAILIPGTPGFLPPALTLLPVADGALRVSGGFRPAIDHPPQLPA